MFDYIALYKNFISNPKSLLISPAGYGKTHTISECLKYTEGKQLVLTHTHAGVASLKEKVKKRGIPSSKYHIETIASFAQKYVNAFYCKNDIPEQDDSNNYFPFIVQKAANLVKIKPIKEVVKLTYVGLFVDEYQDCTRNQHQFILALSEILPVYILGDPLQGIFDFNGEELVDFETDLSDFTDSKFELIEPWRWKNSNSKLGDALKEIRSKLEKEINIDLSQYSSVIEILQIAENDIYSWNEKYNKRIRELLNSENNLLFIYPQSENINARKKLVKTFQNRFHLVEAMDGNDFYNFSKIIDEVDPTSVYNKIYRIACNIFNKSELNNWFNRNQLKKKRHEKDKKIIAPINNTLEKLSQKVSFVLVSQILKQIKNIPNIKCYRKELFYDLCKALEQAEYQKISVYEAMKNIRNAKRRMGRKIKGKCIGTTLLIKGLEFDAVAILNAHKFSDPKNLYVALTRASRRLIVFTNNKVLSPYVH
jgi:DNA helicase-2/ATP-dependent DNA helicase PcrA